MASTRFEKPLFLFLTIRDVRGIYTGMVSGKKIPDENRYRTREQRGPHSPTIRIAARLSAAW